MCLVVWYVFVLVVVCSLYCVRLRVQSSLLLVACCPVFVAWSRILCLFCCSVLIVVCRSLFGVVSYSLFDVCCLLFVVCRFLFVALLPFFCCLLLVACCLSVVCCVRYDGVRCVLVVGYLLFVVPCEWFVGC